MSARAQTVRLTPARHRTLVGFAKTHGLSEYAMLARVVDAGLAALVHGTGNEIDTREIVTELASVSTRIVDVERMLALERRLPIALQFVTFSPDQRAILKKAGTLPRHVETMLESYEQKLTPEQLADPRFAFRVFMVHKTANRSPGADLAVEIVQPGSDVAEKFNMALKEVEKKKYLPQAIVDAIKNEGWDLFNMHSHTQLWKRLNAKDPAKGYGAIAVGQTWCWYETWLNRVREECQQHPAQYRSVQVELPEQVQA